VTTRRRGEPTNSAGSAGAGRQGGGPPPNDGGPRAARRVGSDGRLLWTPVAGDVVLLRRPHVCGTARMVVTVAGLDIRLSCSGCGARVTMRRERVRSQVAELVSTASGGNR